MRSRMRYRSQQKWWDRVIRSRMEYRSLQKWWDRVIRSRIGYRSLQKWWDRFIRPRIRYRSLQKWWDRVIRSRMGYRSLRKGWLGYDLRSGGGGGGGEMKVSSEGRRKGGGHYLIQCYSNQFTLFWYLTQPKVRRLLGAEGGGGTMEGAGLPRGRLLACDGDHAGPGQTSRPFPRLQCPDVWLGHHSRMRCELFCRWPECHFCETYGGMLVGHYRRLYHDSVLQNHRDRIAISGLTIVVRNAGPNTTATIFFTLIIVIVLLSEAFFLIFEFLIIIISYEQVTTFLCLGWKSLWHALSNAVLWARQSGPVSSTCCWW